MADLKSRLPYNVPGPFYVTDQCIDCGMCPELAPMIFKLNAETGSSYVFCQPETEAERQAAAEAKESCPVDAIGDDGAS
jgi:ferredoxin